MRDKSRACCSGDSVMRIFCIVLFGYIFPVFSVVMSTHDGVHVLATVCARF